MRAVRRTVKRRVSTRGAALGVLLVGLLFTVTAESGGKDELPCSLVPPEGGFVVAIGYGTGPAARSARAAREDARQQLTAQVCSGYSSIRCADLSRLVRDWRDSPWDERTRSSCAIAAVERGVLDSLARESEAYERQLDLMAAQVADRAPAGGVRLEIDQSVPLRSDLEAGAQVVRGGLVNALARASVAVVSSTSDSTLVLGVAPARDGLSYSASLLLGGADAAEPVPGGEVSFDVLGIDPDAVQPGSTSGARSRLRPAKGTVQVGDALVEETHWVNGCLDSSTSIEDILSTSAGGPATGEQLVAAQAYLSQTVALCQQYERFVLSAAEYGRRQAELDSWLRSQLAGAVSATGEGGGELTLSVTARRSDGRLLRTGDVVVHKDQFWISAQVSAAGYLYVLYENSAGERVAFPADGTGIPVERGSETRLPSPGFVFGVDANAGRAETVHVVASPVPLPTDPGGVDRAVERARTTRGLIIEPSVVFDGEGQAWYGDPSSVVEGYGAVVYTLSLDHR